MSAVRAGSIKAGLILVGVFAAGAVAGAAAGRLWRAGPAPVVASSEPQPPHGCAGRSSDELVVLFRERLQLDREQLALVDPMLRRGWAEIAGVYEGAEPDVARVRRRVRESIRELLRPEQVALHQALIAELDEKIAARRRCRHEGIEAASRIGGDR
jgi:hypothetical protein